MLNKRFLTYLGRKAAWYLAAFVMAVSLNFLLPRLIPGNPVAGIIHQMASTTGAQSESLERMYRTFMAEFGLDQPVWRQYLHYLGAVARGQMGTSFMQYPAPVGQLIAQALPWTLAIQIPAIIAGWTIGNVFGALCAYKSGTFDRLGIGTALLFSSVPYYCLALILLYLFGVRWQVLPIAGAYSFGMTPALNLPFVLDAVRHYALPFGSMVLVAIGGQAIGMREMALYELTTDYVGYSRALGLSNRKVVGYVFRNASLPQVTGLALAFGTMMGGALVTESVFSYPGVGSLLFTAIRQNDYPVIQGCTLVITTTVLLANFLVDIVYGFIDPRIRAAQTGER